MAKSACLGMPHIGLNGEICDAVVDLVRSNFKTKNTLDVLCADIRRASWQTQIEIGIDNIPSNDFSLYDHVLDTTMLVGNIPRRYYWEGGLVPPEIYFSIVRGQQKDKFDVQGMTSAAWFNTGFSYMVPEICEPMSFAYSDNKPISHFLEAKKLFDISTNVVLFGPVSYIMLSDKDPSANQAEISKGAINKMLHVYEKLFQNLNRLNAKDVIFEEPYLVKDLNREEQSLYKEFYSQIGKIKGNLKIHIATTFGSLGNNLECTMSLGADCIHYDFIHGKDSLDEILNALPESTSLSMGLIDANDGWIADLDEAITLAQRACDKIGSQRVIIAPSSSLALCPLDSALDTEAHKSYAPFLSFAKQKLREVVTITKALNEGRQSVQAELSQNKSLLKGLEKLSEDINKKIDKSIASKGNTPYKRAPFKERKKLQTANIKKMPLLPLTDVGCSPTEPSLCSSTVLSEPMKNAMLDNIKLQERFLDVVNAGEIERRNNIEYFASLIEGIDLTSDKSLRTSGSNYIHVPTIYDISNKVDEHYLEVAKYCASVTSKPLRFSLMGPISLVNMSFVPRGVDLHNCYIHFAHLIGEQIVKLQNNGINFIMIDEPNLLQHLPLRSDNVSHYIRKLGEVFKILASYASDSTQIGIHLRGIKFNEHIESLACFDADVLFLAATNSRLEVLDAFVSYKYPNDIAIGLFNAASNRIPTKAEIHSNLRKCLRVLEESQLWITTDTGTRGRTRKDVSSIFATMSSIANETRKTLQ